MYSKHIWQKMIIIILKYTILTGSIRSYLLTLVLLNQSVSILKHCRWSHLIRIHNVFKVRHLVKIRKRYIRVPHLTQGTTWENNKNTINITNKSQEVRHFPGGDHKAAMNRRESMRNARHKNTNVWKYVLITGMLRVNRLKIECSS